MKAVVLLITSILISFLSFSQVTEIKDVELGFNIGSTCLSSDIQRVKSSDSTGLKSGFGIGFTADVYLLKEKPVGLAIRGRYLHGKARGQAINPVYNLSSYNTLSAAFPSQAYIYPNYQQRYHEGSLELLLTANKLRINTGFILYGMGGIGFYNSQTSTDLYNSLGDSHDYTGIDSNASNMQIAQATAALINQDYETFAANNASSIVDWNPTVGFGIGYDFGPISILYEHKTSFLRNDFIDGIQGDNLLFNRDILHYKSAGIYFKLGYNNELEFTYDDPIDNSTNEIKPKPSVEITRPSADPHRTSNANLSVAAHTENVSGKSEIYVWINNIATRNFNFISGNIMIPTKLNIGQNIVKVKVVNSSGESEDQVKIILEENENPILLPTVNFTTPQANPFETSNFEEKVVAKTEHISGRQNIALFINQVQFQAFEFDSETGMIFLNAPLKAGKNVIKVQVYNNYGSAEDVQIINVVGPMPMVKITKPDIQNRETTSSSIAVEARIENVDQRENLIIRVNGRIITSFSYLISQRKLNFNASLVNGENLIQVRGSNIFGEDQDEIIVIRKSEEKPCDQPEITFITPSSNTTTDKASFRVKVKVSNVNSKSNIRLEVNGQSINSFNYNTSSKELVATVSLNLGVNTIRVIANNDCGESYAIVKITRKQEEKQEEEKEDEKELDDRTQNNTEDKDTNDEKDTLGDSTKKDTDGKNTEDTGKEEQLKDATKNNTGGKEGNYDTMVKDDKTKGGTTENNGNCKTPTIVVERPYDLDAYHDNNPYYFEATITNVSSKNDITFKVDGEEFDYFQYNSSTNKLIVSFPLGKNGSSIEIIAKGNCGDQVSHQQFMKFYPDNGNPNQPRFGNVSPVNNSTVSPQTQIRAQLINIVDEERIQVFVNGQSIESFSFDAARQTLTATVSLQSGQNIVKIKAYSDTGIIVREFTYNVN